MTDESSSKMQESNFNKSHNLLSSFVIERFSIHEKKYFEKLHSTFEPSWDIWTNWRLFNIIAIICDVHFETLCSIFSKLTDVFFKMSNITNYYNNIK